MINVHSAIWMNPQEAVHRGTIETLWRHFSLMFSIFVFILRKTCDVYLCSGTKKMIVYACLQKG